MIAKRLTLFKNHINKYYYYLLLCLGPRRAPGAWVFPLHHHLKTLGTIPQPVLRRKNLGHAFGLNNGYVYEEVPGESLALVPC